MGNRNNRVRKRKRNLRGQHLAEWHVFKKFGLIKPRIKKTIQPQTVVELPTSAGSGDEICNNSPCLAESPNSDVLNSDPSENIASHVLLTGNNYETLFGRRIVDIKWLFTEIKKINDHGIKFGCTFSNMEFQSEISRGLRSGFVLKCNMCNFRYVLWSEPEVTERLDINSAAVASVMATGGGYASLQQFTAGIDIRCMSENTYSIHHAIVSEGWEETAMEEMRVAAEEEATLARERGDVDSQGVPLLTVVADASWAKRSYRTNFTSLSGVVSILYIT